jgi:prenyltransferase beta subunit
MLQIARLSPRQLSDSAALVTGFLHSQLSPDGGFRDRSGQSDLYYTVFGLEALTALSQPPPAGVEAFLHRFGSGASLDLIHMCCLIRCWANLRPGATPLDPPVLAARLEAYRAPDGGYNATTGADTSTTYASFLVLAAYQDLDLPLPGHERLVHSLARLRAADGGYANHPSAATGLTPPTAAAATLLRHLDCEPSAGLAAWLLSRCHPDGGFFATPAAPIPDLLSTATALHALAGLKAPIDSIREPCLDFIDSLWTNRGTFYGNWNDDTPDCEYTYYGLLALGHLSL